MKKTIILVIAFVLMLGCLAGCSYEGATVFKPSTGDKIVIKVEKGEGLAVSGTNNVVIMRDDERVFEGTWYEADAFSEMLQSVELTPEETEFLDSGKHKGNEFFAFTLGDNSWNYVVKIADSNTCLMLQCDISAEVAADTFEHMLVKAK